MKKFFKRKLKNNMKNLVLIVFLIMLTVSSVNAANYMTCEDAVQEGKPFVVYLHSNTCPACKHFTPIFNQMMSRTSYNVVEVNYSYPQNENECSNIQTKTIPAVYVINPEKQTSSEIKYETYFDSILFSKSLSKLMGQ